MDLKTDYLGLTLRHPVIASASPLSAGLDGVLRLADAGAAAVVMASIYEEQIGAQELADAALWDAGSDSHSEATAYFPPQARSNVLDGRLEALRRAAERAGVPVIASLNGCSDTGWVTFARELEQAGAAAIELNISRIPTDPEESGKTVEDGYAGILRRVREAVNVPVSVKLAPFFSAPGHMAARLWREGADGLVLFNRFYEPDIDPDRLAPQADLHLSDPYEARLPLMWIGLLSRRLGANLAASTGVWSAADVVKYLLAGARVTMTASALLKHGPAHIAVLVDGLRAWMEQNGHARIADFRGKLAAHGDTAQSARFLRQEYRLILSTYLAGEHATGEMEGVV